MNPTLWALVTVAVACLIASPAVVWMHVQANGSTGAAAKRIDREDAAYIAELPPGWRAPGDGQPRGYRGRRRNGLFSRLRALGAELAASLNEARVEAWGDDEQAAMVAELHEPGAMPKPEPEPEPQPESQPEPETEPEPQPEPQAEAEPEPQPEPQPQPQPQPQPETADAATSDTTDPEPERHPNPLCRSEMTGWTRSAALALAADIDQRFTEIEAGLDQQIDRWRKGADLTPANTNRGADWAALDSAGAR